MERKDYNCLVVLGPTASGKTQLACKLAYVLKGEIISADSRQVYKYLNIGTGKDLHEYEINEIKIPYHLVDIREPGDQFYLHEFIDACLKSFNEISNRHKMPIICGGTGLYLDSLRKDYSFTQVKENPPLRQQLETLSKELLQQELKKFPASLISHVDINSKKRLVRAIEVAEFLQNHPSQITLEQKPYRPFYIGIAVSADERKHRITARLVDRIDKGLIRETEHLLTLGVSHDRLEFLGLEYKFTSLFIRGIITKAELIEQLQTAIFQYSKRQMTWFRKMEKEGVEIHWVKPGQPVEEIIRSLPPELLSVDSKNY
jgi:tRNA dimethylallyltransferase